MVKVIVLQPRRSDMSPEDFEQHLRETHLPLVTKLPGLRRLVVNRVLPDPNGPPPTYDAVAEDWFDDAAAMSAAFASPEGQAVVADMPNYLDVSRFALLVVEEQEVALPPESAASLPAEKEPIPPPGSASQWTQFGRGGTQRCHQAN